jgi:hypothetical protein
MARIFMDNFESGNLKAWDVIGDYTEVISGNNVVGADGTMYLYMPGYDFQGSTLYKVLPSKSEYYISFRYKYFGAGGPAIYFLNGTTSLAHLYSNTGNNILYFVAGPTTKSVLHTLGRTCLYEIYYKPHNTEGAFQVKFDGITILEFAGDTTNSAITIDGIAFGYGFSYTGFYINDVIIDDATWPGNTRLQSIVPTDVGYSTQWTPEPIGNDNYDCVDDAPNNSADYIRTNVNDKLDLYEMSDIVGTIGTIRAIQPMVNAKSIGNPISTNIQLAIRTNSTNYFSSSKVSPVSYRQLYNIWEDNPHTGDPWQDTEINSIQIGVKSVV